MAVRNVKILQDTRPSNVVSRVVDPSVNRSDKNCLRCDKAGNTVVMPCSQSCVYCPNCLVAFARSQALGGSCKTMLCCEDCFQEWPLGLIRKYGGATDEEVDRISSKLTDNLVLQDGMVRCPGCNVYCKRSNGDLSACVKCENCCRNKAANCWFCWYCRRPWKGSLSSRRCGHERCSEGGEPLHIQEEISRGAYGVVYRGDKNGRTVAAKAVHETLVNIAKSKKYKLKCLVEKFKAEAFLLQSIDHPHIVRCYCLEERGKELYLVMERMRESLFDVIERGDRRKCFSSSSVGKQVASALDYLHSRDPKVIHRDLSSKNVLIGSRNEVKVGDFGMAKCRPRDLDYLQTKSPGALPYMSPEALNNDPKYTEKLDVFSPGVVMLEVETLQHPESNVYGIGYEQEVVRRKKHLDKVSSSNPIKAIIVSCLENDHHKRPTSRQIKERLDKL